MIKLDDLGKLVNPAVPTHMIVVTYNDVNRYPAGSYTPAPNLRMDIFAGNYVPYNGNPVGLLADIAAFHANDHVTVLANNAVEAAAAQHAQSLVAGQVQITDAEPVLAFVYAGLQAFDGAFAFAQGLKQQSKNSTVIVLTCDCSGGHKSHVLKASQEQGEIDDFVIFEDCGGRLAMGVAIDKVITAFWQ